MRNVERPRHRNGRKYENLNVLISRQDAKSSFSSVHQLFVVVPPAPVFEVYKTIDKDNKRVFCLANAGNMVYVGCSDGTIKRFDTEVRGIILKYEKERRKN